VRVPPFVPAGSRACYLVRRQQAAWFITFRGEEFGPYQSEREAILFAVDAAHRLGERGEDAQVLRLDENGDASPVWSHGLDPYPPKR
jgi:hypothetical protein